MNNNTINRSAKVLLIVFTLIFTANAIAQNPRQSILDAQAARFSAMITADIETLQSLLADELTYSHATAWTETKTEFLKTIKSEKVDYVSLEPKEVNVRIYDKTAVLTGDVEVKLIHQSEKKEFTLRFLEVQREINGAWYLVAWQSVINTTNK